VLIELPLWPTLKKVVEARASYTRSLARDDDVNEQIARRDRAENLGEELVSELKAFNVNRKRQTSDRSMPRSSAAGASNITTSDLVLLAKVQSIRRALLALIEVGKAMSRTLSLF
jgi:hypothetical protein